MSLSLVTVHTYRWREATHTRCVKGILKLAYKLLVNDKAKFTALLVGISFAVFLMIQMTAMFARSSQACLRVGFQSRRYRVDYGSGCTDSRKHDRHARLRTGRNAQHPGRQYAVPVYSGGALVKLADGTYPGSECSGAG